MPPGVEQPQLPDCPAIDIPTTAHPHHGDEPEQAGDHQHDEGSGDSPGSVISHGIQPYREEKNRGVLPYPPCHAECDYRDPQVLLLPFQDPPTEQSNYRAEKRLHDVGKSDLSVEPEGGTG